MKPIHLSSIGHLSATLQVPVSVIREAVARLAIKESLLNDVSHFTAADVEKIRAAIETDSPTKQGSKVMGTKGITAQQYLAIVAKAKNCISGLSDMDSLSPQSIADSVIKTCGGDLEKIDTAFAAYGKTQSGENQNSIVASVLKKRRSR